MSVESQHTSFVMEHLLRRTLYGCSDLQIMNAVINATVINATVITAFGLYTNVNPIYDADQSGS